MTNVLEATLDENDTALIAAVLGNIARAKWMSEISEKSGLGHTSLYKALSLDGKPEFKDITR